MQTTILILGGYGVFGGRLVDLLADEHSLTLIVVGRSLHKAELFCKTINAQATLIPQIFDRDGDVATQLSEINPDIVVDASGPFQIYGDDPYRVIKACLSTGIHYLDLADGAEFVSQVSQFDSEAKEKNIFVLSGVSSFPVLTAAVVSELSQGLTTIHTITGGIAPSPYAGVGKNVIRAIANYAGKPVDVVRNGRPSLEFALTDTMRYTISPPGKIPLNNIRFSLVDVPDLKVLPKRYPGLQSIWMGAGPVPEILHRLLNSLAWLVRIKVLPSLSPFTGLFYRVINIMRWGEHRGGMFVSVTGVTDKGANIERSWHLLAEGDDGPYIPSMAVEIIVRNYLQDIYPNPGARAAINEISLADYDSVFLRKTINTGFRGLNEIPQTASLYQKLLGDSWYDLPATIREIHDLASGMVVTGVSQIERGKGILSRLVASMIGFPRAGKDVPVQVVFNKAKNQEVWIRTFGRTSFSSVHSAGRGRQQWLLKECFGPHTFHVALVVKNGQLHFVVRRWCFLGVPMPVCLAPGGVSYEHEQDSRFHFHVEITMPIVGLIVRYQGWLSLNSVDK